MDFGLNLWNSPKKKIKNGKLHAKWIQENAGDAWKNLNHGGKDWESFPTLPVCISFWNSYKFWNNIPQNNNRKKKKIKTNLANPPQRKKKKNSHKVSLWSLWETSGRRKIRGMRKNQSWVFFLSLKVLGTTNGSKVYSKQNPRKKNQKVGILPQQFPLPSQVLGGSRSLRKKNEKKKNPTKPRRTGTGNFCTFFLQGIFRNLGICCLNSQLGEEQGKGAAMNSAH